MPCWLPTKACAWVMALVGQTTVCSNCSIPLSTPRIALRERAMVCNELAILDRPAARIAQQGLSACPLAGHGAVRTRTMQRRRIRSLRLHTQDLLPFRAAETLVIRLFLSGNQLCCERFMMKPRNWVVNIAPRFRSPFWCAMRAASWRSSAANIFCVSAWLRILDDVAVAVKNGVDPGTAWLAALSIES